MSVAISGGHLGVAELLCAHGARLGDEDLARAVAQNPEMAEAIRAAAAKWDAEHREQARP